MTTDQPATAAGVRPARPTLERVICPDCGVWVLRWTRHEGCDQCDEDRFRFLFDYDPTTGREVDHHPCSIKRAAARYAK